MELYPVRSVFGFPELAWSLRQWARKRGSRAWVRVSGVVEGYELLLAGQNGWFVILYSYGFNGQEYSGEYRRWLLFSLSSREVQTEKVIRQFPRGKCIPLRVDPQQPSSSVVDR